MYSTMGPLGRGLGNATGTPLQGPLGPSDFRPYLTPFDWDNLLQVLGGAVGQIPGDVVSGPPYLGDHPIIPDPSPAIAGGWTYNSTSFRQWILLAWGLGEDTTENRIAIQDSLRARYGSIKIPGLGLFGTAMRIGTVGWEGYAQVQTMYGIPIEGWASPTYCGDVIAASEVGQDPGPYTTSLTECMNLITLLQAASGEAGGAQPAADGGVPITYGAGLPEGHPGLPPTVVDDFGGRAPSLDPADLFAPPSTNGGPPPPPVGPGGPGGGPGGTPEGAPVTTAGMGANIGFIGFLALVVLTALGSSSSRR